MAKKQQKNTGRKKTPAQKTDMINTNVFVKGMNKDTDSSYFDKQSWYHARNLINNSVDGDLGVVGNEPANLRCAEIPYTVIGGIHLYHFTNNRTGYYDEIIMKQGNQVVFQEDFETYY